VIAAETIIAPEALDVHAHDLPEGFEIDGLFSCDGTA
jgi:hypothetical protein